MAFMSNATRAMHSRAFGVSIGLLALLGAFFFYFSGLSAPLLSDKGVALPSANMWIQTGGADFFAGLAGSALTVAVMLMLNQIYNVLRSMTYLFVALFSMMQLATPDLMTEFYTGTLLSIVVPACLLLLFSCFRQPQSARRIFLIFCTLSACSATQYCFAVYIPVFLLGLAQMQIFSGRTLTASLLGLITPWWIMLGFGIIDVADIHLPHLVSIFAVTDHADAIMMLVALGITTFAMLVCYILNLLKTIAYNARARAFNGAFSLVALFTLTAICVDFRNIISYIPLLNFSAAMETAHYFTTHRAEKSFIPVYILLAAYATIYVCQTMI